AIHDIESEISAENTTAQDLKKHLNIQQFLKTHCQSRQYTFQVK
ncbi:13023_t:CDS:1, partial [Rhizophagus irregularis]